MVILMTPADEDVDDWVGGWGSLLVGKIVEISFVSETLENTRLVKHRDDFPVLKKMRIRLRHFDGFFNGFPNTCMDID